MRRGWEKVHFLRLERWNIVKNEAIKEIRNLSKKERWLLGIGLYWAEGAKEKEYVRGSTSLKFSNSDPMMILIFQRWLAEFLNLQKDSLRYELYIHEKAD